MSESSKKYLLTLRAKPLNINPIGSGIFLDFLVLLCCALMALIAVLGFFWKEFGQFRNFQYGLTLMLLIVVGTGSLKVVLGHHIRKGFWWLFYLSTLLLVLNATLSQYFSFKLNGVDFSVFDWMIADHYYRKVFYSPICDCNHMGVHPSFIMALLLPLHRVLASPFVLITVHAIAVWSALFPLKVLAKRYFDSHIIIFLVLLAFITNKWTGSILNYGFHIEVFYLPFGLWFLVGWLKRRPSLWVLMAIGLMTIKEDAGLYLAGFALGFFLVKKRTRPQALALGILAISILIVQLTLLQPFFNQTNLRVPQPYLSFWAPYGASVKEIVQYMLSNPFQIIAKIVMGSRWYELFGAALFLPMASLPALMAMLPAMGILGSSHNSLMSGYSLYYSAPLLPFFLWGMISAASRIKLVGSKLFIIVLLIFPLIGSGSLKVYQLRMASKKELAEAVVPLLEKFHEPICVQTAIFPHLDYNLPLKPLTRSCLKEPGRLILINQALGPYPFSQVEIQDIARLAQPGVIYRGKGQGGFILARYRE